MWNTVLIIHTEIDSLITALFLFQIAMLAISMSTRILIIIAGSCSENVHAKDNQQRSSGRRQVDESLEEGYK